jgi:hypothetical protein
VDDGMDDQQLESGGLEVRVLWIIERGGEWFI